MLRISFGTRFFFVGVSFWGRQVDITQPKQERKAKKKKSPLCFSIIGYSCPFFGTGNFSFGRRGAFQKNLFFSFSCVTLHSKLGSRKAQRKKEDGERGRACLIQVIFAATTFSFPSTFLPKKREREKPSRKGLLQPGGPNQQRWHAKRKLSWNMYTLHTCFCTFGAHLYARSVLMNNFFCIGAQSEVC